MRIYNLSRVIAIPFVAAFGFIVYKMFYDVFFDHTIWIIPIGLVLLVLYIFNPQIDYWWQSKFPILLDQELQDMLSRKTKFYNDLSKDQKDRFDKRLPLYIRGREFVAMGSEKKKVPYDFSAMIGQVAIHMSLNHDDFLIGDFDRIYLYKHPFPSPRYQFLHAMETHAEDGMILLSLEHLQAAINSPSQFYHVGYHVYAEAIIKANPTIYWPDMNEGLWDDLEKISRFKKEDVLKSVGFETLDLLPVCINYYFVFPQKFTELLPKLKADFDNIFKV